MKFKTIAIIGFYFLLGCASAQSDDIQDRLLSEPGMSSVEVNGSNIRYFKVGDGAPLVLIHHTRGQLEYFDKIIPALSKHFTVYALDLPGHGGSDIPSSDYSAQSSLAASKGFVQQMKLEKVNLMGESIGGSLVLALAADKEISVAKVVAINAFDGTHGIGEGNRFARIFTALLRTPAVGAVALRVQRKGPFRKILEGGFHNPENLDESLVDRYFDMGKRPGISAAFRKFLQNRSSYQSLSDVFKSIEVPVLSIRGEADWLPAALREEYLSAAKNVKYVTLEKSGHFSSQETPELVVENVLDFL